MYELPKDEEKRFIQAVNSLTPKDLNEIAKKYLQNTVIVILTNDPIYVACALSGADVAYDHVYTNDHFRKWLIDIAFDVATERSEITPDELNARSELFKEYVL